jgi:hypothetical protein
VEVDGKRQTIRVTKPNGVGLAIAFVLVNATIIFGIPSHPDEFSPYHSFACQQATQGLNVYHASCEAIQMKFGPIQYTQSYLYVGVTTSLLMSAFSSLMSPITAHFIMGILALILTTLGMKLSFQIKSGWPLFLIFFPIAFSVIRDGSPARVTVIVFAFLPFLYQKMRTFAKHRRVGLWLFLNILVLLAIEDKPFIFYLAPGLLLVLLAQDVKNSYNSMSRWLLSHTIWFSSLFSASLIFLIGARQNGEMYLSTLAQSNESRLGTFLLFSLLTAVLHMFSWYAFAVRFVDINYDPLREQPQFYEALPWGTGATTVISLTTMTLTAVMMTTYLFSWSRSSIKSVREKRNLDETTLLLVAILLLFFVPVLGGAWTSHHFVFAQLLILVLILREKSRPMRISPQVLIPVLSIVTAFSLAAYPHRSYNSADSRAVVNEALKVASNSDIINCAYSCYFEYSLRNIDDIPITFAITEKDLTSLVALFSGERRVFHICKECKDAKEFSENELQANLLLQKGEWSLYQMKIIK